MNLFTYSLPLSRLSRRLSRKEHRYMPNLLVFFFSPQARHVDQSISTLFITHRDTYLFFNDTSNEVAVYS